MGAAALYALAAPAFAGLTIHSGLKAGAQVPRYDILEFTMELPEGVQVTDPLSQVEVSAEFIGPGGRTRRVGGFYHGERKWKVRFAPDQVGRWDYRCQMSGAPGSGLVGTTKVRGWFNCVESDNPGFVRQNPKNKFLWVFDNGDPYWPIGIQECIGPGSDGNPFTEWSLEGGDRYSPWVSSDATAEQYLDTYAQAGFNLFRFSPDNCSYSHYKDLDHYNLREMRWTDELLLLLRQHGYRVFYGFFGYARAYIHEPDDAAKMAKVKRFLKYCVDRWGAYVDFWELLNEQEADPKWTAMMAEYVKSIDPYHHPITDWEKEGLEEIDFTSPHWYQRECEEAADAITRDKANEWKKLGKPVIVGEQGNDENVWDYTSARRMRYRTWSALFNEISFIFWNTSYALNGHFMNIYLGPEERQYIRALQNFTTYLDTGMRSAPVKRSDEKFRAYAFISDRLAAVYLHNRFGRSLKGSTITITVPRAGWGYWLEPATLRLLGSFRVGAGEQTLPLPDFRRDMALLISPEPITGGPPTPIIEASPRFGVNPQRVILDGRRSVGAFGRPIVSYQWTLGDGATASGPRVVHTYPTGNYLLTLTVTDDRGEKASASLVIRVAAKMAEHRPPIVTARAIPTTGKAPLRVHFKGEAFALTDRLSGVSWRFGDGATSDQLDTVHVYDKPGTYLATLIANTSHDGRSSASVVVTVK